MKMTFGQFAMNQTDLAMEAINFKNNGLGKQLEGWVVKVRETHKDPKAFREDKELQREFTTIVYDKQNAMINLEIQSGGSTCAILVPQYTANTIFRKNLDGYSWIKDTVNTEIKIASAQFRKAKEINKRNTIDLKTGFRSGVFSDIPATLFLSDVLVLNETLTPAMLAAMLLHEIGHDNAAVEFIGRQVTTNQGLAYISRSLMEKKTPAEMEVVFAEVAEHIGIDPSKFNRIKDSGSLMIIVPVVFYESFNLYSSEIGTEGYDANQFEYLADKFVAGQGYGRELVTASQLYSRLTPVAPRSHGPASGFSDEGTTTAKIRLASSIRTVAGYLSLMFGIFGLLALISAPLLPYLYGTAIMTNPNYLLMVLCGVVSFYCMNKFFALAVTNADAGPHGFAGESADYPSLRTRYARMKENYIDMLKDKNLDSKIKKELLVDIDIIDEAINAEHNGHKFTDKIMAFFSTATKSRLDAIELQRQLEQLANNSLFTGAARLSSI